MIFIENYKALRLLNQKLINFKSNLLSLVIGVTLIVSWDMAFAESGVVIIRAPKDGRVQKIGSGRSDIAIPTVPSEKDSSVQLKKTTSTREEDVGEPSPSGGSVPRIRHQAARLSEIWLEDVPLFNPYSGLSSATITHLDFLGAMEIHRGVSSYQVMTGNPVGVIRYKKLLKDQKQVMLKLGDFYGQKLSGSNSFVGAHGAHIQFAEIYAHAYQSEGKFEYYDDGGTPFETKDDATATRKNNGGRSQFVGSDIRFILGGNGCKFMSLIDDSNRSFPGPTRDPFNVSLGTKTFFSDLGCKRNIAGWEFGLAANLRGEARDTYDREGKLIAGVDRSEMILDSKSVRINADRNLSKIKLKTQLTTSQVSVLRKWNGHNSEYRHDQNRMVIATKLPLGKRTALEMKLDGRMVKGTSEDLHVESISQAKSFALSTRWPKLRVYAQLGTYERPPTLVETLGDGLGIEGNSNLKSESLFHIESGMKFRIAPNRSIIGSIYLDRGEEKVVLIPTSFNRIKPQNVRSSQVSGVECEYQGMLWSDVTFDIGVSYARAEDYSSSSRTRNLPYSPEWSSIGRVQKDVGWGGLTLLGRYRSKVFKDIENSFLIDDQMFFDVMFDRAFEIGVIKHHLSFYVSNLTDARDVEVKNIGGIERIGRSAINDFAGYPLPGRTVSLSYRINF